MNHRFCFFALCGLLLLLSCRDEKELNCTMYHWEYEGITGPVFWAECNPDCNGQAQSPVNIAGPVSDPLLPPLFPNYEDVPVHPVNNGHTVEFEYEPGSLLTYNGED